MARRNVSESSPSGGHVAGQVVEEGEQVAAGTHRQARDLVGEASAYLREQAETQQRRAAEGLRTIGTEFQSMAGRGEPDGLATELAHRAADAAQQAAGWLESREPGELVDEVRGYARRHPGAFLAGAAVAGLLVGRLTHGRTTVGPTGQRDDAQPSADGDGHRQVEEGGYVVTPAVTPEGTLYAPVEGATTYPGATATSPGSLRSEVWPE